jgi:DNA primase
VLSNLLNTMKIQQNTIDQVRLASDIVDVVSGYLTLRKKGNNFFGLCPFHQEKTPSFSVNQELQIFHCFGCGAGGNVFTFVMRIEGLTFPETVKMLARTAGITIPEEAEDLDQVRLKEALYFANKLAAGFFAEKLKSPDAKAAREYLAKRGITPDICHTFGIGFALDRWDGLLNHAIAQRLKEEILFKAGLVIQKEENRYYDRFRGRITFSIINLNGQVVGFGARRIIDDDSPKYINSPETDIYQKRHVLYGLFLARDDIRRADQVVIVEGYTDLISLHQAGLKNAVATSGTALTEDHAHLLRRYTANAIILYDADSAGATASIRGADILLEAGFEVRICSLPLGQDPDEFAREFGLKAIQDLLSRAIPLIEFKIQGLEKDGKLNTAAQKTDATRDLLASISKVTDSIQRSFLVQDLAKKLKLEENVLWTEIGKLDRHVRRESVTTTPLKAKKNPYFETRKGAAELGLIKVVTFKPDLTPVVLSHISAEDFSHPEIKSYFQQLQSVSENYATWHAAFLTSIQDSEIAESLSTVMFKEKFTEPAKYARDCIITLKLTQIDEKIEAVRKEMPGTVGERALELLELFKSLQHERKEIEKRIGEEFQV